MDRISHLSDSLLLRILTKLPTADVMATMVLSKRWLPLWKSVPDLFFDDDSYEDINTGRFSRFVERSLILHKAPIETLCFQLTKTSSVGDIGIWTELAVLRCVGDLSIDIDCTSITTPVILPRSLYTCCGMLVTLELNSVTLVDSSSMPSFSTLKTLKLLSVKYPDDEFVKRLLSSCHVLEDLGVEQCLHDNVTVFAVRVPSLKKATLAKSSDRYSDEEDGFVIDAPSLEMLNVFNEGSGFCIIENDMPNIVKANVVISHCSTGIMSAITSVKHLNLCLSDMYSDSTAFHRLVHLNICTCESAWLNVLMCVLRDSPSLKSIKLKLDCTRDQEQHPYWNEHSSVPVCLLTSLETLEWVDYKGTEEEKKVAAFILRSGSCLKMVKISSEPTDSDSD